MTKLGMIMIAIMLAAIATGCTNGGWALSQAPKQAPEPSPSPTAAPVAVEPAAEVVQPAQAAVESELDSESQKAVRDYLADLDAAREPEPAPVKPPLAAKPAETPITLETEESSETRLQANAAVSLPPKQAEQQNKRLDHPAPPRVTHVSLLGGDTLPGGASEEPTVGAQRELDVAKQADLSLAQLIAEAEADLLEDPINAQKQWRLSLLRMAANQPYDAAALSPAMSQESRALITRMVAVMDSAGRLLRDPLASADETLASVDELRDALRDNAELSIPIVAFCTKVTNFGIYDELPTAMLRPYQVNNVIVYWEVKNCRTEKDDSDGHYHASLSSRLELFTSDGRSVWVDEQSKIEDYAKQRREDFFLAQLVTLPADIGPGDYVMKVTMTDRLAEKTNQAVHPFTIAAPDHAPALTGP